MKNARMKSRTMQFQRPARGQNSVLCPTSWPPFLVASREALFQEGVAGELKNSMFATDIKKFYNFQVLGKLTNH
jgi:hypothetical protein